MPIDATPQGPVTGTTHGVEVTCALGTIHWSPNPQVYGMMPRTTRDKFLDLTGENKIKPYLNDLAGRLLRQAGVSVSPDSLDSTWCLETREDTCTCYGSLVWMMGQGIYDVLPEDQRNVLLDTIVGTVHCFLRDNIMPVLMAYAQRTFQQ